MTRSKAVLALAAALIVVGGAAYLLMPKHFPDSFTVLRDGQPFFICKFSPVTDPFTGKLTYHCGYAGGQPLLGIGIDHDAGDTSHVMLRASSTTLTAVTWTQLKDGVTIGPYIDPVFRKPHGNPVQISAQP